MKRNSPIFPKQTHKNDGTLWTEKYQPKKLDDLPFFSPQKIDSKIRPVFLNSFRRGEVTPRLLIFTGFTGCGRTSYIQFVCETEHINIIPFSPDEEYIHENKSGEYSKFDFLHSFAEFLEKTQLITQPNQNQLLLLENFPIPQHQRRQFIEILRAYALNPHTIFPLCWIPDFDDQCVTMVQREIVNLTFKFTRCPTTALKRALINICISEGIRSDKKSAISLIQPLLINNPGDIRLAVNSLQFCPEVQDRFSDIESKTVTSVYQNLNTFEALGKILYRKEDDSTTVLRMSSLTPQQFENQLYENYLDFYLDVQDIFDASEAFSLVDPIINYCWQLPNMIESSVALVMESVKQANRHPAVSRFKSLREGYKSRLRPNEVGPAQDFLCPPDGAMTADQMDAVLFSPQNTFEKMMGNRYRITEKENNSMQLHVTPEELEEQSKLLEEDPIED